MDFCGDEKRFQSKFLYITLTKPLMSFGSLGTIIMISYNELVWSLLVYLNEKSPLKLLNYEKCTYVMRWRIYSIDDIPFLCFATQNTCVCIKS